MFRRKLIRPGFTLVELLVVLVIIGILAAVATPLYLTHTKRAKASEAVAQMALIRQAERDFKVNHDTYFDVATNKVANPVPTRPVTLATGAVNSADVTDGTDGLDVNIGTAQYFANKAFVVDAVDQTAAGFSGKFATPDAVDFVIFANGSTTAAHGAQNVACTAGVTDCAVKNGDVATYQLEMDNSGRIFISYDSGTKWQAY